MSEKEPDKFILRNGQAKYFSAVTKPAQEGATVMLIKRADDAADNVDGGGDSLPESRQEEVMSDEQKGQETVDNTAELTKLQEQVAALEATTKRQTSIIAMSADQRAHFEGLDGDDADAFLAKSSDDRDAELEAVQKAAEDADPVVYTARDGMEIRKSDGDTVLSLVKRADALEAENAEIKKAETQARLEKRADDELGNLPGTVEARAALLGAVEGVDGAAEILKAANDAASVNTQEAAWDNGRVAKSDDEAEADEQAQAVQKIMDAEKITKEQARRQWYRTEEGRAYRRKVRSESQHVVSEE